MSARRMRRVAVAACAIALGVAACDSPIVPPRLIAYQFAFEGFGEPVVYRWPDGQTIGVHVLPTGDPTRDALFDQAFRHTASVWNDAVLYGEYRIERVGLDRADVLLAWANQALPLDTSGCPPLPVGAAWTTFCADSADTTRIGFYPLTEGEHREDGVHMIVQVLDDQTDEDRVAALVAHEFGHVLGIGRHPCRLEQTGCTRRTGTHQSLMFSGVPERLTPSAADRSTIEVLYHTRPHLTP